MLYRLLDCHHDLRDRLASQKIGAAEADAVVREASLNFPYSNISIFFPHISLANSCVYFSEIVLFVDFFCAFEAWMVGASS